MTPPPPEVKALFRAPFKTCPMDRFVMSEDGNMAASTEGDDEFHPGGEFMIPRGWGRTSYTKGAGPTHDAWCDWFEANIPTTANAVECARLLNEAWK